MPPELSLCVSLELRHDREQRGARPEDSKQQPGLLRHRPCPVPKCQLALHPIKATVLDACSGKAVRNRSVRAFGAEEREQLVGEIVAAHVGGRPADSGRQRDRPAEGEQISNSTAVEHIADGVRARRFQSGVIACVVGARDAGQTRVMPKQVGVQLD